ncbi:hypothetical protein HG535_0C04910 [Zygotorulaspora mrakii]|uniref:Target of rapamycin complex 2 subunit BIT2 n=1 Tax=Zygotorulaspora mrakii TaxID=42260 RepID=A0A7H9B0X6_ZYGMR|nr:uncharacterized protein HG535_0C04910 [Zygotorulaspora mrakii]QLG72137.1 hypothetical protein HG535_0C04910 [Zygotorulaspora mrakii]
MNQALNRKRSATTSLQLAQQNNDENSSPQKNRTRFYSISSDIIPQTLTHPNEDDTVKPPKSPNLFPPSWSHVGFQSIFQGGGQRRSKQSLLSDNSQEDLSFSNVRSNESSIERSGYPVGRSTPRISEEDLSNESIHTTGSSAKDKIRSAIKSISKDTINNHERSSRLFRTNTNKSSNSVASALFSGSVPNKQSRLKKAASKLFLHKPHGQTYDDIAEPALPSSLSKFLHSSYARHKAPSQFIHNTAGLSMEAKKAASQNYQIERPSQDDASVTNVALLKELLKNLPTLEANYKSFHTQELQILQENVWGVYCSIVYELFKSKRLWQLPVKIEDINRVLSFYITLKNDSKVASSQNRFLTEIEEFLTTSLYGLENQIVFNYANENTMNTALKRLGVIWQIFYQYVYYDLMAVLMPLENCFNNGRRYRAETSFNENSTPRAFSIDYILLNCFRDSIVLPYYQNFINCDDGVSKSFHAYILNEEEENGVTEQDKLTLLQCFGVLSSTQVSDRSQTIVEELLEGVRMSI